MKCPCCGKEMVMDAHTKIDKFMCYECGYVEGRMLPNSHTKNYNCSRVHTLDDAFSFLSRGLSNAAH